MRVARTGEGRGVHRFLVGKPKGKRPLGRPKRRWEDVGLCIVCVVLCIVCFVSFYVLYVCKCVLLPPGDNPIAVNKYIISVLTFGRLMTHIYVVPHI